MIGQRKAWAFSLVLCVGIFLRFIWASDMEYKEDEFYMFERLMKVGVSEPWPWLGISSGVHIRNPGLSVWVFIWLGKLLGTQDPVTLCRAVMGLNVIALFLMIPFIRKFIALENREPWYWAIALAAVNPFAVTVQRKIWAQSVLPVFSLMFLAAWMSRRTRLGSFFWGFIGAFIGQIHMSGFPFALGFFLWALLWDRKKIFWGHWVVGSCLASLTLVPWLIHVFTEPTGHPAAHGWVEAVQLRYWVFWLTDPVGLHLGKSVGVGYGNAWHEQLREFFKFPLFNGSPTYLVAVLHAALLIITVYAYGLPVIRSIRKFFGFDSVDPSVDQRAVSTSSHSFPIDTRSACKRMKSALARWISVENPTQFSILAALIPYGILLTLPGIRIYRFYLIITFPLLFVWFARFILNHHRENAYKILSAFVIAQILMCFAFLSFIHVNGGAPAGDYGKAYRLQGEGDHHR